MAAYQFDDIGQPINLSNSEASFKELWRNIDALALPDLNPQMIVDGPTFDPSVFFQKLSWAQAELGVVMDVVDGVLAMQSLRVQTISHHGEERAGSSRATKYNTEEYINLAVAIFEKAKADMPDTLNEIEDLRKLVALRVAGWPVLRLGLNWFASYSHESILNLPLDMSRVVPLQCGQVEEIRPDHTKLLQISNQHSSISISLGVLAGSNSQLAIGLLSSLDSAIFSMIRGSKSDSLSETSDGSLVLGLSGVELTFGLVRNAVTQGDTGHLTRIALKLYRSFIDSRGKSIDL